MLIGELARQTGLTPATIRFYEQRGLLSDCFITRKDNNYKDYGLEAAERLRLVAQSKWAGFTLREIAEMLQGWDTRTPAQWLKILTGKETQIEQRMAEMEQVKSYPSAKIARLAERNAP